MTEVADDVLTIDVPVNVRPPTSIPPAAGVSLAALALAACGDGGGGSGASAGAIATGPTPTPSPAPPAPPTEAQAGRFLAQASMGATRQEIDAVVTGGYDTWITSQFATPRDISHWDWLIAKGYNADINKNSENGFNNTVWRQLISGRDTLRQRVGLSLLDFLVVGIGGLNTSWKAFAAAAYLDILWDNAFGNFRELLDRITLSPAMAYYLTYLGNRKANAASGAQPDENYARELMQLFTLGLYKLNADGTQQLVGGKPVESYVQDDVSGLARVFTGFVLDSSDSNTPDRLRRNVTQKASDHENGVKTFLGATVPAGTDGFASLKIALDTIFAHPNVPPFVSHQLIQRLVTSNPSPAYVGRISAIFANNGSGVRGDLKAVIRAILLDSEARAGSTLTDPNFGKLRAPVVRLTNWARAFSVTSPSDAWAIGDTSNPVNRLAQMAGRSPSVFNFFRPGYIPPNSDLVAANLVAPEFQITAEQSVIGYVNYMQSLIQNGTADVKADYAALLPKAGDSSALVNDVNILLAAGQLSSATLGTIRSAVDSIAAASTVQRVYTAILLTMASPDYLVQR